MTSDMEVDTKRVRTRANALARRSLPPDPPRSEIDWSVPQGDAFLRQTASGGWVLE